MSDRLAVGVDVGGTKIALALVGTQGQTLAAHRLATRPKDGVGVVIDRIAHGIDTLLAQTDHPVDGIGIGSPGYVNPVEGIVHSAVNLHWTDVPLSSELHARLAADLPIWLDNDANAAALGEMYFGAARGCRDFVYISVGTGLGGAAIIDGKVLIGSDACAMDIGHMPLEPDGRLCACGQRGCPEAYISGGGLLAGVRENAARYPDSPLACNPELSTTDVLNAAQAGDSLALAVLDEAARWLGRVMACCATIFNPALFVLDGGLGHAAADFLIDTAWQELNRRTLPAVRDRLRIVCAEVNNSAIGAACLVWHNS